MARQPSRPAGGARSGSSRRTSRSGFSRTDRISSVIREIVATELERLVDERLEMVTVTTVVVDNDLATAKVYYSDLVAKSENRDDVVAEALEDIRWPIQKVVNRQISARRTPQVSFHPDEVLTAALRIEDIVAGRIAPEPSDLDESS